MNFPKISSRRGLTFIEIMITIVVLSLGIVVILRSFVVSLDQINHLTNRLYVTTLLDNRLNTMERILRSYKVLPLDLNYFEEVDVGAKRIKFQQHMEIKTVEDFPDVFGVDLSFSWKENRRQKQLLRSAYLLDFDVPEEPQ